ncbi:hypothetical protein DER44DRAFT_809863 [Fusarium oxysporum]|nr:hypothetical protein DER44DRAFT_809863 [Fusarium oxysporum]
MIPHRTPSISDASTSSAKDTSQTGGPRRLLPAARPQPAESSNHYQTAPLTRKRAPIALACEACRQKKIKVSIVPTLRIMAAAHRYLQCNGARPVCSQCQARKLECALLESHPAAVVYRAIQTRPRSEALEIVRRIQAGVDAETLMRQLSSADLLLQFIYSPLMPTYLQTDDNPFMRSLIHEWSTRDDIVSIASPVFTNTDLGYRAQYLRPHHAATIVDSRLDEIVPSKWTTVDVSDDTMKELIRFHFLQEYDWFTFFHKDYFLDDMINGSNTFCPSLLVNAVLAVGCPLLKAPPKTPFPDPDRDPEWFGEIWLKYPSSSTLVPLRLGLLFKAKMRFSVVLNEAMLEVEKDSTDSYLFRNGATRIIKIAERMDTWYKAMPEPLSPTQIVSPSQLKIHLHHCYVIIQLYEILAPGGQRQAPNLPIEEEELRKSLSKYRGYFETILRIHYLRHSFEYGNMMLTRFLAMLAFLSLNKIESLTTSTEPEHIITGSGLDVGDTDPKEAKATLLIAQKGLSDQGRGYYLPKTLLRDILTNMTASDATILQSFITIPPEGPEKMQERKMYMESHCPPDILRIANDPSKQPDGNWIQRFAILTLGEKSARSILGMISGGRES